MPLRSLKNHSMKITVRELIEELKAYNPNDEVRFSGLQLYRTKDRKGYVQVEFEEQILEPEDGGLEIHTDHLQNQDPTP